MEILRGQEKADRGEDHSGEIDPQGVTLIGGPGPDPGAIVDRRAAVEVDIGVYSLNAVLRAAYKFTDRCYVFVARDGSRCDRAIVVLTRKTDDVTLEVVIGEFSNELLDQQVRESLAREFGDVRTLIAAQAFSEGNLLDPERDDGNYETDARGALRRR